MGERIRVEQIDKELVIESIPQPILTELTLPPHWCRDVWNSVELRNQVLPALTALIQTNFLSLTIESYPSINVQLPNGVKITSIDHLKNGKTLAFTTTNGKITMTTIYHYDEGGLLIALTKFIPPHNSNQQPTSYHIHNLQEYLEQLINVDSKS
ncbi:hypothetical protein [Persephonella sp.]